MVCGAWGRGDGGGLVGRRVACEVAIWGRNGRWTIGEGGSGGDGGVWRRGGGSNSVKVIVRACCRGEATIGRQTLLASLAYVRRSGLPAAEARMSTGDGHRGNDRRPSCGHVHRRVGPRNCGPVGSAGVGCAQASGPAKRIGRRRCVGGSEALRPIAVSGGQWRSHGVAGMRGRGASARVRRAGHGPRRRAALGPADHVPARGGLARDGDQTRRPLSRRTAIC